MVRRLLIALPATLVLLPVVAWGATTCSVQSPSASQTGTPSGQFTTQNGQIIGPNGQPFQPRGVDVLWGNQPDAATLTQDFPGVNFVRLAVYNYASPSDLSAYVNSLTSQGIVVELEDHTNSTGANAGGGQGSAFTGQQLTNELNWYSSIGSAFASNPNVWFGTNNEPLGQGLSTWEQQTYNAIRSSGNNNPIMMEFPGGGESGFNVSSYGMDPSVYANMSNIIGDVHFYGWQANNSTDQGTVNAALNSLVQGAQTMQSASGPVPVIIGEYGTATDGQNADPNEAQVLQAVQSSGVGNVAWATMTGTSGQDALLAPGGALLHGSAVVELAASG